MSRRRRRRMRMNFGCVRDCSGKLPAAAGTWNVKPDPRDKGSEKRNGSEGQPRGARHNQNQKQCRGAGLMGELHSLLSQRDEGVFTEERNNITNSVGEQD